MSAIQICINPKDHIYEPFSAAQKAYKKLLEAERGAHRAARVALSEIYKFACAALTSDTLPDIYDECKITVREDAAANPFIQPIKLVIGRPEFDEARYVSRWLFDSTRLGQFANICYYAHHLDITVEDFPGWLEDTDRSGGTITAANQLAQQSGLLPGPCRIEETFDPLAFIANHISPRWSEAVGEDVSIQLDLEKVGIRPGMVQLVGNVDEDGNLQILGVVQMDEAAVGRELKKFIADRPIPHEVLIDAAKFAADGSAVKLTNGEGGVFFQSDNDEPYTYSEEPDSFLPMNETVVLGPDIVAGVLTIANNFDDTFWALFDTKLVVSVPGGSVEKALAVINKARRNKGKKAIKLASMKLNDGMLELPIKTLNGKGE